MPAVTRQAVLGTVGALRWLVGLNLNWIKSCDTLSTILKHCTHTMKPSDLLLLTDGILHCGMCLEGKVAISGQACLVLFINNWPHCGCLRSTERPTDFLACFGTSTLLSRILLFANSKIDSPMLHSNIAKLGLLPPRRRNTSTYQL